MAVAILPLCYFLVEVAFWTGLIAASGNELLAGFPLRYYIGYFLYIILQLGSLNWRFERIMIAEINSGAVNALLLRPSSFYEYHLGQLLGQKLTTAFAMIPVILFIAWYWDLPFHVERLPAVLLMGICYLMVLFSLNFAIASMAFFFDHVYSLNTSKNMLIWILSGELMPLDLLPSPLREWVIALPFSCGIYIPAAYLSGRIDTPAFMNGFISLAVGGIVFGLLAQFVWRRGLRRYSGTGA
ncbi:MAG: ABC-2 family transporter protein [Parachlamydiaceae bacterium]|nr:ABC-2 family transporter protein [Parachlamydiaceae bacterium]